MDPSRIDVSLRPIMGEKEVAVAWLAERNVRPTKTEWGRYTLEEPGSRSTMGVGIKFLIVDNLGIEDDDDLARSAQSLAATERLDADSEVLGGVEQRLARRDLRLLLPGIVRDGGRLGLLVHLGFSRSVTKPTD